MPAGKTVAIVAGAVVALAGAAGLTTWLVLRNRKPAVKCDPAQCAFPFACPAGKGACVVISTNRSPANMDVPVPQFSGAAQVLAYFGSQTLQMTGAPGDVLFNSTPILAPGSQVALTVSGSLIKVGNLQGWTYFAAEPDTIRLSYIVDQTASETFDLTLTYIGPNSFVLGGADPAYPNVTLSLINPTSCSAGAVCGGAFVCYQNGNDGCSLSNVSRIPGTALPVSVLSKIARMQQLFYRGTKFVRRGATGEWDFLFAPPILSGGGWMQFSHPARAVRSGPTRSARGPPTLTMTCSWSPCWTTVSPSSTSLACGRPAPSTSSGRTTRPCWPPLTQPQSERKQVTPIPASGALWSIQNVCLSCLKHPVETL